MKTSWNNMISLLPLQEFMSWTFVQGKFHTSVSCFIFYVDSLHTAWTLHQVPPKLLRLGPISHGYLSCWSNFSLCILPFGSFVDHHPLGLLRLTKQSMHCSAPSKYAC
ncbi:hypothetical protein GW17_00027470 [Ensete ventricosum]|nr:hypothetical protein GW17_00027470 [Ensete ventricosum]